MLLPAQVIQKKRDGKALTEEEIRLCQRGVHQRRVARDTDGRTRDGHLFSENEFRRDNVADSGDG